MEWLSMIGTGRGWLEAALLIGFFWAALVHPDRIRSVTEFRIATLLLGVSMVVPVMVSLFLVGLNGCHTIADHHATERACDRNRVGPSSDGIFCAVGVNPRAEGFFHPHARSTCAAAKSSVLVAFHFLDFNTGHGVNQ